MEEVESLWEPPRRAAFALQSLVRDDWHTLTSSIRIASPIIGRLFVSPNTSVGCSTSSDVLCSTTHAGRISQILASTAMHELRQSVKPAAHSALECLTRLQGYLERMDASFDVLEQLQIALVGEVFAMHGLLEELDQAKLSASTSSSKQSTPHKGSGGAKLQGPVLLEATRERQRIGRNIKRLLDSLQQFWANADTTQTLVQDTLQQLTTHVSVVTQWLQQTAGPALRTLYLLSQLQTLAEHFPNSAQQQQSHVISPTNSAAFFGSEDSSSGAAAHTIITAQTSDDESTLVPRSANAGNSCALSDSAEFMSSAPPGPAGGRDDMLRRVFCVAQLLGGASVNQQRLSGGGGGGNEAAVTSSALGSLTSTEASEHDLCRALLQVSRSLLKLTAVCQGLCTVACGGRRAGGNSNRTRGRAASRRRGNSVFHNAAAATESSSPSSSPVDDLNERGGVLSSSTSAPELTEVAEAFLLAAVIGIGAPVDASSSEEPDSVRDVFGGAATELDQSDEWRMSLALAKQLLAEGSAGQATRLDQLSRLTTDGHKRTVVAQSIQREARQSLQSALHELPALLQSTILVDIVQLAKLVTKAEASRNFPVGGAAANASDRTPAPQAECASQPTPSAAEADADTIRGGVVEAPAVESGSTHEQLAEDSTVTARQNGAVDIGNHVEQEEVGQEKGLLVAASSAVRDRSLLEEAALQHQGETDELLHLLLLERAKSVTLESRLQAAARREQDLLAMIDKYQQSTTARHDASSLPSISSADGGEQVAQLQRHVVALTLRMRKLEEENIALIEAHGPIH